MLKVNNLTKLGALVLIAVASLTVAIHQTATASSSAMTAADGGSAEGDGNADGAFCSGMFMIMAMDGFQWSLFGTKSSTKPACLNYFAPAWKLDGAGKFQGAMIYSFLLAIMTEGFHFFTRWIQARMERQWKLKKYHQHAILSILYGIQRFLGYILMFIAMMYTWELLLSIIVGVMFGRVLFPNAVRREWRAEASRRRSLLGQQEHTSRYETLASTIDESDRPLSEIGLFEEDGRAGQETNPNVDIVVDEGGDDTAVRRRRRVE